MNRPSLTWLKLAGLATVFAGARVFDAVAWLRLPLIIAGGVAVVLVAVRRLAAWRGAEGDRRTIDTVFAFGAIGCLVALLGFVPGSDDGLEFLGLDFEGIREQVRFKRFFQMASPILLACSLLPVLAAEWALARGGSAGALQVDARRVRETAGNALSLAIGGAALVLIGYVTSALNRTADFSYFKTSSPGESVQEIVRNLDGTLEAALFFPEVNLVKDEVLNYLRALAAAADNVVIEEYDRYADPEAAAAYEVRNDGVLVLRVGGRSERIPFQLLLSEARGRLRILDSYVQQALLVLTRERRFVYLTTGHGELNDPLATDEEPERPDLTEPWRPGGNPRFDEGPPLGALREMLEFLNYEVRDIGVRRGLGDRIPDDAAMVMVIGPQRAFLEAELGAIHEYLDRGGSVLFALEPGSDFRLDGFREQLGVDHDPVQALSDDRHLSMTGALGERRNVITNRFSAHASVTTASRRGVNQGIVLFGPGRISVAEDVEGLRTNLIISTDPSSYQDRNDNFRFDGETEVKESFGVAAAIESDSIDMRALVYADAEIFSDEVLIGAQLNAMLVADGIRWLGREEAFSGEVVSEEDVPILHTRSENVVWFYAIIFAAPALVLALGMTALYGRRGRGDTPA